MLFFMILHIIILEILNKLKERVNMRQLVNFEELIKNEDVIHIRNGHAYKICDGETIIWNVFDYETDEIYLLVDNEVFDLQYELDLDFYQMVATIKNHKTYN